MTDSFFVEESSSEQSLVFWIEKGRLKQVFSCFANRLNFGDVVEGKISAYNAVLRGYFVETSLQKTVFVPSQEKFSQGQAVRVKITKEVRFGKDATGEFVPFETPLVRLNLKEYLQQKFPDVPFEMPQENVLDLLDEALESEIRFADGAKILISATPAVICVDVDSGSSTLPLEKINLLAVEKIYEEIQLKNLAGQIVVDFAGFKSFELKEKIFQALKKAFGSDSRTKLYGFTKMNLFELKRARTTTPLIDLFLTQSGLKNKMYVNLLIKKALLCKKGGNALLYVHPDQLPYLTDEIKLSAQIVVKTDCAPDFFEIV